MAPKDVESALKQAVARTSPPGLVSAYLFGSHADGRAHRESDIDVGVLLDRRLFGGPGARFDERVRLAAWLIGELHANAIDVVVLNDAPPTLGRRIVTSGRRVFVSDPNQDHAFVRDVQLRAADLEPFLRRMRRLKLAALSR